MVRDLVVMQEMWLGGFASGNTRRGRWRRGATFCSSKGKGQGLEDPRGNRQKERKVDRGKKGGSFCRKEQEEHNFEKGSIKKKGPGQGCFPGGAEKRGFWRGA